MSVPGIHYHMEDPSHKARGTVGSSTLKVIAGCSSSDDGDSVRSDGTDEYVPVLGCFPVNRRKRKMLQPKRAAMYGSEVAGVWCDSTAESQCYRPRPVKQRVEVTHTPLITLRPVSAAQKPVPAPAASKPMQPSSSTAAKCSKKPCSPQCGPCGNCGTTTSPQWRHGNDKKPIVCNACGIRYLRTGSFEKAPQSEKKRAASGGSGAVSGGACRAKRCKIDSQLESSVNTCPVDNSPEAVSRPASRATTDSGRSSPTDTVLSNAASPCASPAITPSAADTVSTPASPLRLDGLCANNAAGSTAYAANHHTRAGQQHVSTHRGRHSHSGSCLGPSPLGRVSRPSDPTPAGDAPAPGQLTTHPVMAEFVPVGQAVGSTIPSRAETAISAAPVASIPSTAVAASAINGTAAGTAAAQLVVQPELLQVLSILATRMGSFDAAISYLKASAGAMAASNMVAPGPVVGVQGQVPARIHW